jgi:phosphotransferase system enzyme I (PtsI)
MKARIRGVPGSPGIAAGRAWVVSGSEPPKRTRRISPEQVESEWSAFNACVEVCEQQLERVSSRVLESVGPAEASIFEAQKMMLLDPAFKRSVRESIARELIGVETAVRQVTDEIAGTLSRLTDPYLAARATDVRDLARRILFTLSGQEPAGLANVPPGSIVVAEDLTPSDSALMDKKNVLGIVLELGGAACI